MSVKVSESDLQAAYDRVWAAVQQREQAEAALDAARREHREAWDELESLLNNLDPRHAG